MTRYHSALQEIATVGIANVTRIHAAAAHWQIRGNQRSSTSSSIWSASLAGAALNAAVPRNVRSQCCCCREPRFLALALPRRRLASAPARLPSASRKAFSGLPSGMMKGRPLPSGAMLAAETWKPVRRPCALNEKRTDYIIRRECLRIS